MQSSLTKEELFLTKEEIINLIVRVTSRISRLELQLSQDKFNNDSKDSDEVEFLREVKSKLVAILTNKQ